MERIVLSKRAKQVLRLLNAGVSSCPTNMSQKDFNLGALEAQGVGLALCYQEEGGEVVEARLTDLGQCYLAMNPRLSNPIDWKWTIGTAIALVSLIISIVALLVACAN